ncbi:MAG: WxcM-like domain-containing protein [Roseomonas sp.]|nr:WxcM-like domain-containing protein [Roseomonas sp.]
MDTPARPRAQRRTVIQTIRWKTFDLPKIADRRGNLTVIESETNLPFKIERVYFIYDVPSGSVRAGHAHRQLRQLFLALSGSFTIRLEDGQRRETFMLKRPDSGLLVEPGVWREIDDFSGGAVCLVLASMHYDEADYIRSYEDFRSYAAQQGATG